MYSTVSAYTTVRYDLQAFLGFTSLLDTVAQLGLKL